MAESLSSDEARRVALRAQGLLGRQDAPRTPGAVLDTLGALQLDTISVLARSHELVCYARCGPVGRPAVEAACWGTAPDGAPRALEYWAHAACVLPLATWPWWAFRRRRFRQTRRWSLAAHPEVLDGVRQRLATEGPLNSSQLGGAKQGGPWWDWSPVKMAVELLLDWGEVVCTTRVGWKRVYTLAELAVPDHLLGEDLDDATCLVNLVADAGRRLGVATRDDLAEYYRLLKADVEAVLPEAGLVPVEVEGWRQPAWADPAALERLGQRGRHRTTLLSPFDSLVWDRARTRRIFGFHHHIEAYTPAPKRVHGYYAMPVLTGGQLVGRVDPARRGRTFVARQVGIAHPGALPAVAEAITGAAAWVGADDVIVERVEPPGLQPALLAALG